MSGGKAWLANLALAAGSVLLVLLIVELTLRLVGFAPERRLATRRIVDPGWTRLLDCYPSNPRGYFEIDLRDPEIHDLYFGIAPYRFDSIARWHPWAVESRYNELRFRDVPPAPREAGTYRVVVFGDSFTEGQGVKAEHTIARVLEDLLNESGDGRYEVRNCGRRGLDLPELMDGFGAALHYEADLVIYALVLNDAVRPPEFQARQTYINDWILDRERLPDETVELPGFFHPRTFDLVADRIGAWRVGRETTRWYLDMWGEGNPQGWARTQELIREMERLSNRRGARFLVAIWPLFVGLEGPYPFAPAHQTIGRFCVGAGIPVHDLLPVFLGRRSSELWVHPVDRHPNEIAHRMAAESLAPVVLRLAEAP
ncbi:MAG: SGNH/GDSL hydrolase family protein [Acidobacteria bacterium]|nr:SGNH/GDSL hydrolase family protein [Acidobacteriota bacterium]